jgi:hypothetical protein
MSVFDNVRVGGHRCSRSNFLSDALGLSSASREERALADAAWEIVGYSAVTYVQFRSGHGGGAHNVRAGIVTSGTGNPVFQCTKGKEWTCRE